MKAKAFCPSHITGIFKICKHKDPLKRGSIGAGICLAKGLKTRIKIKESGSKEVRIFFNGKEIKEKITYQALKEILGENLKIYKIVVNHESKVPYACGFGLSAAYAINTLLCLNELFNLGLTKERICQIAHKIELRNKTGLGDVIAELTGGFVVREVEGALPHGKVRKIEVSEDLKVVCGIWGKIETKNILTQGEWKLRINEAADLFLPKLFEYPSLENLLRYARRFALKVRIGSRDIFNFLKRTKNFAQIMIGNCVFTVVPEGDVEYVINLLEDVNCPKIIVSEISNREAKLLK